MAKAKKGKKPAPEAVKVDPELEEFMNDIRPADIRPAEEAPAPEEAGTDHPMKLGGMVAAFAEIMGAKEPGEEASLEEQNAWKKRMLLASAPKAPDGSSLLSFPADFDSLPEEEKAKRLDLVIEQTQIKI